MKTSVFIGWQYTKCRLKKRHSTPDESKGSSVSWYFKIFLPPSWVTTFDLSPRHLISQIALALYAGACRWLRNELPKRIHVIPLTLIPRVVGNACTLHCITDYLASISRSEAAYGYALCCRLNVTTTNTSIVPRRGLLINHPDHPV